MLRALLVIALVILFVVSMRTPSLDRSWDEDVGVLAGVDIGTDQSITLTNVRDWQYAINSITAKRYFDETFNPDDIVNLWLYEQQLDSTGLIAHTFVVFEFKESYGRSKYLGLSVETRRELDEEYSVVGGALRKFEITHIWATEEDLVTRRVQFLDYPLTRYRLDIPAEYRAQIFRKFAEETRSLASQPQWYNTVTNNCTSSLLRYVNASEADAIPMHHSYVFTGLVDEYLEELGFKSADYSLYVTREYLKSESLR